MDIIEARREILLDVRARLANELLNVKSGYYVFGIIPKEICDIELQPNIDVLEKNCSVCAKGALFLSTVRKFNDYLLPLDDIETDEMIKHKDYLYVDTINKPLFRYFYRRELALIECAFEGSLIDDNEFDDESDEYDSYEDIPDVKDALAFFRYYENQTDSEILYEIVTNMLENNTYFKPALIKKNDINEPIGD